MRNTTQEPAFIYQQGEEEQSGGTLAVPKPNWAKSAIKAAFESFYFILFSVRFPEHLKPLFSLYKKHWLQDPEHEVGIL